MWKVLDSFRLVWETLGGSHRRCSIEKGVLKDFTKFTRKDLYWSLFFNKVVGWSPRQVFSCELWKIFKNPFLRNTPGRLLLLKATKNYENSWKKTLEKFYSFKYFLIHLSLVMLPNYLYERLAQKFKSVISFFLKSWAKMG